MPPQSSPPLRFLLRATLLTATLLAVWWLVLLDPMLVGLRASAEFLIRALPGGNASYNIAVKAEGAWEIRLPVPVSILERAGYARVPGGPGVRGVRLTIERQVLTGFTVALPVFWAVMLAAPRDKRLWRNLATGSLFFGLLAPALVLIQAAATVRGILFHGSHHPASVVLELAAYLAGHVAPSALPVLAAVALNDGLRKQVMALSDSSHSSLQS